MSSNLIIGAGAIGTVLAGYLMAARRETRIAILEEEVAGISAADGLCVDRITGRPPLRVPKPKVAVRPEPLPGENVFICVKYRDLGPLLDSMPAQLPAGVTLIPCLNGVGASRELQLRYPDTPVAALTVMFNAQLLEPLHARITARPQVLINTDDRELLTLFGRTGVEVRRAAGESAAWGKLLINLANGICALTHTTFKDLLTEPDMTACFVALLDEAVEALHRADIAYTLPIPLPYSWYRLILLHGGPLPWWVGRLKNNMSEGSYPSMVADVRHGKTTEVRQLNGEIVRLAQSQGRQAPCNATVMQMVEALEGQAQHSFLSPSELRNRLFSR